MMDYLYGLFFTLTMVAVAFCASSFLYGEPMWGTVSGIFALLFFSVALLINAQREGR